MIQLDETACHALVAKSQSPLSLCSSDAFYQSSCMVVSGWVVTCTCHLCVNAGLLCNGLMWKLLAGLLCNGLMWKLPGSCGAIGRHSLGDVCPPMAPSPHMHMVAHQ
jgi:hypothetical protein